VSGSDWIQNQCNLLRKFVLDAHSAPRLVEFLQRLDAIERMVGSTPQSAESLLFLLETDLKTADDVRGGRS
jgi:hypothetical protein